MKVMKAAAIVAALALALGGAVLAQDAAGPAKTPPSWEALVHCIQLPDDDAQLACFRAAMRAAGYAPKPEEVAAQQRRRFGLSMPKLNILRHAAREKGAEEAGQGEAVAAAATAESSIDPDQVTAELDDVGAILPGGQLLLFTTDGALWQQTDTQHVTPQPKKGQKIVIKKGSLGGYFCQFDKWTRVPCVRRR
jgi:hypothetical protein